MRIYRISIRVADDDSHDGYSFATSRREAEQAVSKLPKQFSAVIEEPEDVPLTKAGVLRALQRWASHPNNG